MRYFLFGAVLGLLIGWATVPMVKATVYSINRSDSVVTVPLNDDDDFRASHAYKWYLQQMLLNIKSVNDHLAKIEENTKAVKEKLHA